MSAVAATPSATPADALPFSRKTVAELLDELGGIPAHRVRVYPPPGTATEADVIRLGPVARFCELVDGTLVERPVGRPEGILAAYLATLLNNFVLPRGLGTVAVPDAIYRMRQGNLREPDVSFTSQDREVYPLAQVSGVCPDLCVEVLSPDNTRAEMARKRVEYFATGCRLVWEIDPRRRTASVYTDPDAATRLGPDGFLDGGAVLPGFALPLADLFARLDPPTTPTA
ncbi:MAG: Uma2 family endonuclease [Gemmataceae bacterium]